MAKTIRAKFKGGIFEPLEKIELEEGKEVEVIIPAKIEKVLEALKETAGAWKDTINCEKLLKDIYESRRLSAKRPEVKL
jgi:predicted DNA-binding antitoxin AbrB/MazE fold protein